MLSPKAFYEESRESIVILCFFMTNFTQLLYILRSTKFHDNITILNQSIQIY